MGRYPIVRTPHFLFWRRALYLCISYEYDMERYSFDNRDMFWGCINLIVAQMQLSVSLVLFLSGVIMLTTCRIEVAIVSPMSVYCDYI